MNNLNLFFTIVLLCCYSAFAAAQSRTVPLPTFTAVDQPAPAKGTFLEAAAPWQPASGTRPSTVAPEILAFTPDSWELHGTGWSLDNGRARISAPPSTAPAVLASPSFRVPEGRHLLRYAEKYELESYRDFGSVWILAEGDAAWRQVHALTGVSDWRNTYLNLSPYAGRSIRVAFTLTTDATIDGAGWEIGELAVVQPHRAAPHSADKPADDPIAKVVQDLNLILTGRETNTFPRISATVRAENIPDLTRTNFTVTENDVTQNFDIVLPQGGVARPADIVFVVDNSGSMAPFQNAISNTITDFVTELFDSSINAALGLTRFGQSSSFGAPIVEENGTLFTDPDVFLNSVFSRNIAFGSNEPGLDAIDVSVSNFNFRPNSQKIFILLTDEDNDGSTEPGDVLPGLQANASTLYSLIDVFDGSSQFDYGDLANDSGGQQFDINEVDDPATLEPIIDAIEADIAADDAYFISYTTTNPALDGTERTVNIIASRDGQLDTVSFTYTPGDAPIIELAASTLALIDSPQPMNVPLTIQATITDLSEPFVQSATLLYRSTGDVSYTTVPLVNVGGDLYEGVIPAAVVQMPGVDFYLTATDGISTTSDRATSPAENPYQIAVNPNVAPVITSTPVTSLTEGEDLVISAEIVDNTNTVASASLFYRNVGEPLFNEVPCVNTGGNTYVATVPADQLSSSGVEYYIRATDDFGINAYFGTPDDPIQVEITPVVSVPSDLTLDPETVSVVVGVETCITGTVLDQFGDPLAGVEVFTEVDGVVVGSGISDAFGEVEYCFTPTEGGLVNIVCFYQGGDRVTAVVTVTEPAATNIFTLLDADADTVVLEMQDGAMYSVEDLPESIAIRGNFDPDSTGSVFFRLTGPFRYTRTENLFAYSLFGNRGDDYFGRIFPPGEYKLQATPYSGRRRTGEAGPTEEINFTIVLGPLPDSLSVTGFELYDATTDQPLQELTDGDVIDLSTLDNNDLTVLILTMPDFVGSVRTELRGPINSTRVENNRPYTLFGNNSTNFFGRAFLPGSYTLKATAYAEANAAGTAGEPLEIAFEVVEGATASGRQSVYPMPFQREFTVENLDGTRIDAVRVFDGNGQAIGAQVQTTGPSARVTLTDSSRPATLIVRTVNADRTVRTRLVQRMR